MYPSCNVQPLYKARATPYYPYSEAGSLVPRPFGNEARGWVATPYALAYMSTITFISGVIKFCGPRENGDLSNF